MDAIARHLGLDRAEVRSRNFILPEEMPYDHGLMFQDGRPLKYDSGDFPASLAKLKELIGWDEFADYRAEAEAEGRKVGLGIGCACLVAEFVGMPVVVTLWSILISFSVAAAVGIFFGFYPARKAAQLRPIEALRYQ